MIERVGDELFDHNPLGADLVPTWCQPVRLIAR